MSACRCLVLGAGVQTFRIRDPKRIFEVVVNLGHDSEHMIGGRAVWKCRECGQHFAWLRLPYKDEDDRIVRAPDANWQNWDWPALAKIADGCGWRGEYFDDRYVL